MTSLQKVVKRVPLLNTVALFAYRARLALRYYRTPLKALLSWLVNSRETTNFTYELTPLNQRYLAALVADVLTRPYDEILAYMTELANDVELQDHVRAATQAAEADRADSQARFGRRVGWYAIVRAVKPAIVVETGVDKGLGSCVLTAALARNAEEGSPGYYYGTDINPNAGYLLRGKYERFGEILYGDSISSLRQLERSIDVFINDSDHSAEYEQAEYQAIAHKLTRDAIVLGDNSHCTDRLLAFALDTERQFVFFHESPDRHWYPGGGIGIAFRRR